MLGQFPATRRALRRALPATEGAPARSRLDSAARPRVGSYVAVDDSTAAVNTGSEGNERATEAIKTCAVTRSAAPSVWHAASVDPYVAPARVVQEREIPADVQGCCCGSVFSDNDPFPGPVQLP